MYYPKYDSSMYGENTTMNYMPILQFRDQFKCHVI